MLALDGEPSATEQNAMLGGNSNGLIATPTGAGLKSCRRRWPLLLETVPAEHRASLRWPEGQRGLLATLRAHRSGLGPG